MSSRVRLMLQDFGRGNASTGKTAFTHLQELYKDWEKEETKGGKRSQVTWKHFSNEYAAEHPFTCTMYYKPIKDCMQWEGPGFYQKTYDQVDTPGKKVPPLPAGPKWRVALEMWTRLQDALGGNYRLFISRDNRKHAWRKSLCNPFYQQFGWKARKTAPKKVKQAGTRTATTGGTGSYWENSERRYEIGREFIPNLTRTPRTPEQPKPTPVKPRVGIWT